MSREPLRVPLSPLAPGEITLPAEAAAYVTRVHRLGPGDGLIAFDPERAMESDASIVSVSRRAVTVRVGPLRPASRIPRRRVTVVQGLGKGDKLDAIVRDATELGATEVRAVYTERSVPRPRDEGARLERWRRIAVEAARQSGRGDVPRLTPPGPLAQALDALAEDGAARRVCLHPQGKRGHGAALRGLGPDEGVIVLVGPEGGFSETELVACDAAGFLRTRLGSLTLRTETACAAFLGALLAAEPEPEPEAGPKPELAPER